MKNFMKPSLLYESILNCLNEMPLEIQSEILEDLKKLSWIPKFLEPLNKSELDVAKRQNIGMLSDETVPVCLMSITCFLYNLKKKGVDAIELEEAINSSNRNKEEILATLSNLK